MGKTEIVEKKYHGEYAGRRLIRSNSFVTASIDLSATAYDVYLLALYKARNSIDKYGRPYAVISSSEVRSITSRDDGNLYRKFKTIRDELFNLGLVVDDDEHHRFLAIRVVNLCTYENGVFTIVFTPEILPYISDLTSKYSSVDLGYMFSFNGYYPKRLYDLLKVNAYRIPKDNEWLQVRIELAQLRFSMGCIDIADMAAKEYMSAHPGDYEGLERAADRVKLRSYSNFKARALEPALKQINACSDLDVRYENACSGKGGRVVAIVFYIRRKAEAPGCAAAIEAVVEGTHGADAGRGYGQGSLEAVIDCVGEKISKKQAGDLLDAAGGDMEKIRKAVDLSRQQGDIRNLVAWLVAAIKNSYADEVAVHMVNGHAVGQEGCLDGSVGNIGDTEEQERMAKSVYEKRIQTSEFEEYLRYMGMTECELVQIYPTYDERVTKFLQWKVGRNHS